MTTLLPKAAAPRHRDRLALPAGERLDGLGHVLQRADAEGRHLVLGPLAHPAAVEHPEHRPHDAGLAHLAAEEEVARDVERGRDRQGLVDRLDAGGARLDGAAERDPVAVEQHVAGVRDLRSRQALDQARLARAVVADHGEHLARVDGEVAGVQRDHAAVRLDQGPALEHGLGRGLVDGCGHARALRIHWSAVTARMTRMPMASRL
jgi:hypothetical protein